MPESTRHRRAFERYWRLGSERSIEKLHAAMSSEGSGPSLRTLYEWSRRYRWQDRLADLERQARAAEDEARVAAIREMQERQAKEGLLLQQKGAEWLAQIETEHASPEAAIRAVVEGARLERLARGEATERTEIRDDTDPKLQRLSEKELDRLIELAEGLRGEDAPRSGE